MRERIVAAHSRGLALSGFLEHFRPERLQIIGFGRYASSLTVEQLAGVEPDYVQGTNLQHALKIAGRHLRRHPEAEPAHRVEGTQRVLDVAAAEQDPDKEQF